MPIHIEHFVPHNSHNFSFQPFFHDQMVINTIAINTKQKGKKLLIKFGIEKLGL
jgi:hypothetical protein